MRGDETVPHVQEDSWADYHLRRVHGVGAAVGEGDGETCSKFRLDEIRNGSSC